MRKFCFSLILGLLLAQTGLAQQVIPLWPKGVPNSEPSDEKEQREVNNQGMVHINFVQQPDITVYPAPADHNTGVAVVICPGGGYWRQAWTKEGVEVAEWLNSIGVTGVILKYRLPHSKSIIVRHEAPLQDAQQAIRLVRSRAADWGVQPSKVGIMGFSAGGHLASTAATHFDPGDATAKEPAAKVSSRPDFAILVYPVVTMKKDFTHQGSRDNLLGENPSPELVEHFSNELQVTANTPPTFLIHGQDDPVVPVENSLQFYAALQEHGVPAEIHIYKHGPHGFGINYAPEPISGWPKLAADWLKTLSDIRLANLFGDGMVLQRDIEVPVWGWGDPGDSVTVELNGKSYPTQVDANGRWQAHVSPMSAGGPFTLSVKGKQNEVQVRDILIGDVWICGGQSNMEWPAALVNNAEKEIASADWPEIRHFKVARKMATSPLREVTPAKWQRAVGENIRDFTAVGYFFARELYKEIKVPIGLINDNWGGTVAQTWASPEALKRLPDFRNAVAENQKDPRSVEQIQYQAQAARGTQTPLAERDLGMEMGLPMWAAPKLDDGNWKTMTLPGLWEAANAGMGDFDGIVWFRKTVELPADAAGKALRLNVGRVDDSDQTWFNGIQVGGVEMQYALPRSYEVPGNLVRSGANVITVRVNDTGGGGGIWGPVDQLSLETADGSFSTSLASDWKYKIGVKTNDGLVRNLGPNDRVSLLYNGMLKPVIPYAIKGAIWYQGESNAGRAFQYRTLFPAMIADWRQQWGQGDFPFLFVQLANWRGVQPQPGESDWAELREAQTMSLSVPNTGMAVIIDIGEAEDIHPRNKQDVGKRLALSAQKVAYGMDVVASGPMYAGMTIEGDKIRISFKSVGSGLVAKDKYGYLKGFAIAGSDHKFVWANAEIDGETVVVSNPQVKEPIAVRYAWADNPDDANLYNKEGLPASPFRTDEWPGVTYSAK